MSISIETIKMLLSKSIELERNMGSLYLLFSDYFQEDKDFWWQLCLEENNHAALLESIEFGFFSINFCVEDLLAADINTLKKDNQKICKIIEQFTDNVPTQGHACQIALDLESLAAEFHYQQFMEKNTPERVICLFQELNAADKDHVRRIENFMKEKGYK